MSRYRSAVFQRMCENRPTVRINMDKS